MSKDPKANLTPNGLAISGSLLKLVETATCKVGMRVQDANGNQGTVRWVGKLDKNPPPPPTSMGDSPKGVTYAGVQFDEPKPNSPWRCDGSLSGIKLVPDALPGTVAFLQPKKDLFECIIPPCLEEMRRRFGEAVAQWHDVEVVKFLIARKFDLKLASEMLENHLKWEKEQNALTSVKEYFPEKMADWYPIGMQPNHYDYEGNLIRVERPANGGKIEAKDFVAEFGLPLIMRWHIASVEQCKERMRREGWKTQRVTFIIDLKNLSGITTDVGKFGQMEGKIDQDHYPEMMARCFMINAPWYFTGLWKMVRLFVDDRTKDKIKILGEDYKKELLRYVPEEAIPSCAGGANDSWLEATKGGRVGALEPTGAAVAVPKTDVEEKTAAEMAKFLEEHQAELEKKAAEDEEREKQRLEQQQAGDDTEESRDVSESTATTSTMASPSKVADDEAAEKKTE